MKTGDRGRGDRFIARLTRARSHKEKGPRSRDTSSSAPASGQTLGGNDPLDVTALNKVAGSAPNNG